MEARRTTMDPDEAERRFAARLEEAALPAFVSAEHDTELDLLQVTWAHGVTLYMDLTRNDIVEPIDEHGRAVILGLQAMLRRVRRGDRCLRPRLLGRPPHRHLDPGRRGPPRSSASPG